MKYFASQISENLHKTPEGYLLATGVSIGRTGVMEYVAGETPLEVGPDGLVRVAREADELFKPETIASFEGKPFTIRHPEDFVDISNWKVLAKGHMQNVRRGEGDKNQDLIADLLITDKEAIVLIESGMRQLSCGYEAEYIKTGEGQGIQKNIIGNHVALVDEGRAGDAYKIKDHKGVKKMSTLETALKKLFGKTSDEIMQEAELKEKEEQSKDAKSYDELVAMVKDLVEKIEKIGQPMDEKKEEKEVKDEEVAPSLEERLKSLEDKVSKLLEMEAAEAAAEEVEDEKEEEEEVKMKLTGDEKSKVEILAPGFKAVTEDYKTIALKVAYKTADGKKHIDALTGGNPSFSNEVEIGILFNAVPELLKQDRASDFARTKDFSAIAFKDSLPGALTAEQMNELNAKFYSNKR
jgi:hypothetical protein